MKASELIEKIGRGEMDSTFAHYYKNIESQKERYIQAIQKFIELFGEEEVMIFSTPGRSEICGNHTDHQHGDVMAAAIDLDMIAVCSLADEIKVVSDGYDIPSISLSDLTIKEEEKGTSAALIRGVVYKLKEENYAVGGFKGYFTSDVLQGSGMSSSAAFEVMIGTIESSLYNHGEISKVEIAKIGQYSENVYFGKPCGLMDQCACSVGGFIHIDFKDAAKPVVEALNYDFNKSGSSLCIIDVHASHADLTDDYAAVPSEMKQVAQYFREEYLRDVKEEDFYSSINELRKTLSDRCVLRAIHFYNEQKRVREAVLALNNQDFEAFKKVIEESGNSSFKYLQNIYSPHDAANQAVSLALAISENYLKQKGVCRVHGGGFAGTIQAFVSNDYVDTYAKQIEGYFGKGSCHILSIRKEGGIRVF